MKLFHIHHWHYDCQAAFPYLYVEATCFKCGKQELIRDLTVGEWFNFSKAWVWDKHNPAVIELRSTNARTKETKRPIQ